MGVSRDTKYVIAAVVALGLVVLLVLQLFVLQKPRRFIGFDECSSNPCQNDGVCNDGIFEYSCQCTAGYEGDNCEIDTDECSSNPCVQGVCRDSINGFKCQCYDGYCGDLCDEELNECSSSPCENGGVCHDFGNSYACECPAGYEGENCETDTDDCSPDPCAYGTCVDCVNTFTCNCDAGYTGRLCGTNIDDCDPDPCQNGAPCIDLVDDYQCDCPAGYGGKDCEDHFACCSPNPCQNGGVCIDNDGTYECQCPIGYSGQHCEIEPHCCVPNPCLNGGDCVPNGADYRCVCADGYAGRDCQLKKGHSYENPGDSCLDILNHGTYADGAYWVKTRGGPVLTACDMSEGGWTLVGEYGGFVAGMEGSWLRSNINTADLVGTEMNAEGYACIDAVLMAVKYASKIRLSHEGHGYRMGGHWVQWNLPAGRTIATFWNQAAVTPADLTGVAVPVFVTSDHGELKDMCSQNKYGLSPNGGAYPATTIDQSGSTNAHDVCLSVATLADGVSSNGWVGSNSARDCPKQCEDWPNEAVGDDCSVSVWLK